MKYLLFLLILIIPFSIAQSDTLGVFAKGQNVNLIQICSNCTYNNISSIIAPNGSFILTNLAMTKDGTAYNYTLSNQYTQTLGRYIVNGFGDLDGQVTVWSYDYYITPTGLKANDGERSILIFLDITFFILAIVIFAFALYLPPNIFKLGLFGLSAIFLIAGFMFSVTLAQNYIENNELLTTSYERFMFLLMILGFAVFIIALFFVVLQTVKLIQRVTRFSDD